MTVDGPNNGKRGTAPCGCPGFHVTPSYVTCAFGCDGPGSGDESDGVPLDGDSGDSGDEDSDPNRTKPLCVACGSSDVEKWDSGFSRLGKPLWTCRQCGKDFHA